jgi:hypothetical protein
VENTEDGTGKDTVDDPVDDSVFRALVPAVIAVRGGALPQGLPEKTKTPLSRLRIDAEQTKNFHL